MQRQELEHAQHTSGNNWCARGCSKPWKRGVNRGLQPQCISLKTNLEPPSTLPQMHCGQGTHLNNQTWWHTMRYTCHARCTRLKPGNMVHHCYSVVHFGACINDNVLATGIVLLKHTGRIHQLTCVRRSCFWLTLVPPFVPALLHLRPGQQTRASASGHQAQPPAATPACIDTTCMLCWRTRNRWQRLLTMCPKYIVRSSRGKNAGCCPRMGCAYQPLRSRGQWFQAGVSCQQASWQAAKGDISAVVEWRV